MEVHSDALVLYLDPPLKYHHVCRADQWEDAESEVGTGKDAGKGLERHLYLEFSLAHRKIQTPLCRNQEIDHLKEKERRKWVPDS